MERTRGLHISSTPYESLALLGRTSETGEEYSSYGYNYAGNNISSRDFSGASEEYIYDGMNRGTAVTDSMGGTIVNKYDMAGNLIETLGQIGVRWKSDTISG